MGENTRGRAARKRSNVWRNEREVHTGERGLRGGVKVEGAGGGLKEGGRTAKGRGTNEVGEREGVDLGKEEEHRKRRRKVKKRVAG